MGDDKFADDRLYGNRYVESAGEDLFVVAGRILSDLKVDQHEDQLPASAVFVLGVAGTTITVQVHLQSKSDIERWNERPGTLRARVTTIAERYNWRGVHNRADARYSVSCSVRTVQGRLDATTLGSLIG